MTAPLHAPTRCPSAEDIAALCDGRLPAGEAEALLEHASDCSTCAELLAELGAFQGVQSGAAHARTEPSRIRRPVILWAALAAAALLVLAVGLGGRMRDWQARREVAASEAALRTIMAGARAIEPRLTADLPFGPMLPTYRSGGPVVVDERSLALEALALRTEEQLAKGRHPDRLRVLASVELSRRRYDRAIELLSEATASSPEEARCHADLGAALLARSLSAGHVPDANRALSEIEKARRLGGDNRQVLFNRALALGALDRRDEAHSAWKSFLVAEGAGPWADFAREMLAKRSPSS